MSKGINIYTENHWMLRPPTNCCKLTKGELTKIILEEVRNLQEQEDDQVNLGNEILENMKQEMVQYVQNLNTENENKKIVLVYDFIQKLKEQP
jgi:hypothetical protein